MPAAFLARLRKGLCNVLFGLADPAAQQVGGLVTEMRRIHFSGKPLAERGFPGSRRAVKQNAFRRLDADFLEQFRIQQWQFYDFLDLIDLVLQRDK